MQKKLKDDKAHDNADNGVDDSHDELMETLDTIGSISEHNWSQYWTDSKTST